MTRLALQEAAAAIVVGYLSHHEVETEALPVLVAAVGRALTQVPAQPDVPLPEPQITPRRRKTKAPIAGDLENRRIEHVDQLEMPWQDEVGVGQAIEGKEDLGDQTAQLIGERMDKAASAQETGSYPRRSGATTGVVEGIGVPITRLPEVRRGRRRLA